MTTPPSALPEPANNRTPNGNTNSDGYTATIETYDDHITTLMYNVIDVYSSETETMTEDDFEKATCRVITNSPWLQTPIKTINASKTKPDNPDHTPSWSEVTPDDADWDTAIQEAAHICVFNDVMRKLHN